MGNSTSSKKDVKILFKCRSWQELQDRIGYFADITNENNSLWTVKIPESRCEFEIGYPWTTYWTGSIKRDARVRIKLKGFENPRREFQGGGQSQTLVDRRYLDGSDLVKLTVFCYKNAVAV